MPRDPAARLANCTGRQHSPYEPVRPQSLKAVGEHDAEVPL